MELGTTVKRKRPVGVTILAVMFLYIGCIGTIFIPIGLAASGMMPFLHVLQMYLGKFIHAGPLLTFSTDALLVVWYLAYVLYALIGFGLWKLKSWARRAVIAICIISLAIGMLLLIWVRPLELALAILTLDALQMGLIWWYMSWLNVRFAFGEPVEVLPDKRRGLKIGLIVGCSVVFGLALFTGLLMLFIENLIHHSGAYSAAMVVAEASPCVRETIGAPLKSGWLISGGEDTQGDSGSADLNIPVKGPKGEGNLMVDATETAGQWTVTTMHFAQGKRQFVLLPASGEKGCVAAP